jgi:TolA-binding protein
MKYVIALVLGLVLQSCLVTRGQVKENEKMEQTMTTLQKSNADVNNRFAEIDEDMRGMNGRIEVLENKVKTKDQDSEKDRKSLADQNAELSRKVALLQESLVKMEGQINQLSADVANARAERAAAPVAKEKDAPAAKKTSYDTAEDHFGKKEWKKAILNYEKYRQEYPKGKNFADATYKIGVSFQELKMKDEAQTFYEEVLNKFPKSDEARRAKTRLKSIK